MTIANRAFEDITAGDISALIGASADPQRIALLGAWSKSDAAAAAASLANTAGGIVLVGVDADAAARATSVAGTSASPADLASAIADLGPAGRHLCRAGILDVGGKPVGVIAVAACAAPPVLVESSGAIYQRSDSGLARVLTRAGLDGVLAKERSARQLAERNLEGMIERLAFGHFSYMTVAVVAASRALSDAPYEWASGNRVSLLELDFAKEWKLSASHISVRPGEIEVALGDEVTGFIRVSRNGSVGVGERLRRPPQDVFVAPAELSRKLGTMAAAAAALFATMRGGPVVPGLFLEGARDLRLPVDGGTTAVVTRDTFREFVPERYLQAAEEREAMGEDIRRAAGAIFSADLLKGTGEAKPAPVQAPSVQPQAWHGLTKRTERRIAGLRGHGSGR